MTKRNQVGMSRNIAIEVRFDRSIRLWCGVFRHRETQDQIGDAWWGISRDEVLVYGGMHWMGYGRLVENDELVAV
jgi:hypothetical protein